MRPRPAARRACGSCAAPATAWPCAQLQQLDRPLDVGEPAAAELGVGRRVRAARQPLGCRRAPSAGGSRRGRADATPLGRVADRVDQRDEARAPSSASPATNRARSSACASHGRRPPRVVLRVRSRASAPAGRCAPPGAGRRRCPAAGRSTTARPAGRAAARRCPARRAPRRLRRAGRRRGREDEHHVGVRAVADLGARPGGPSR